MHGLHEHREMLRAEQLRRLRAAGVESGSWAGWIYFHAALRDTIALEALRKERGLGPDDQLALDLLLAPVPDGLAARLKDAEDPWLFYTAVKTLLRASKVDEALQVVESSIARGTTAAINLLIQYLLQAGGRELAAELINISLQLAPRQQDLQRAIETGIRAQRRLPLYLDPFPKPMPCAFYLPAYNMAAYIDRAIEGALAQSAPLDGFLIVDDGSTDDTAAIAARYPVQVIRHPENRGLSAARNTAFSATETPWVASVDADAYPAADFLKYAFMEVENSAPDVAGVGGRLLEHYTDTPADLWRSLHLSQNPGPQRIQPPDFLFGSNTVYSREAILQAGGFDERFRTNAEDGYIADQLRAAGHTFSYTPLATAHHLRRDSPSSVIRMFWGWALDTLEKKGALDSAERILEDIARRVREMVTLVNDDLAAGHPAAAYVDVLYFFGASGIALRTAVARGHLSAAHAKDLEARLLNALSLISTRFDRRLEARVRGDMAGLPEWPEPPEISESLRALLAPALAALEEVFEAITPEVYEVLAGAP